ncbi:TAZ [Branchiostoma lanceolatum]|uniref:Tafazzin family protein n=1 Tax=Branchiostoma lanceolatum TaxID=7740 RepID=A0A8K0EVD3_BRALA|nr:TAZ [Branchiostoma lanceolatum]
MLLSTLRRMWSGILKWRYLCSRKQVRWTLAAEDICFTNRLHAIFFCLGQTIPVRRGGGVYQRGVDFMVEQLNRGRWVHMFPEGKTHRKRYRDTILDPVAIPFLHNTGPNALLQDDNARPHRAGIIADHLQHAGVERMEWPSKSADLNPIEHLWDQLGRAVRARVTERTMLADLGRLLVEEWDAIPQHRIARLVTSMRRRCRAVVTARGWATRKVNMTQEMIRLKWGVGRLIEECQQTPVVIPIWHVGMDTVLPNVKPYIPRSGKRVTVLVGQPFQLHSILTQLRKDQKSPMEKRKVLTDHIQDQFVRLKAETEALHYQTVDS